ncbi:carbohydrate ABC transporter permease [Microbacterium ulmi]|uniref:Carbohydrate ABC transporter permease n=1 Tax=Microbacterium ulmi TaxID=179095 RepID=A0A7Y2LZD4_9MICO|nr:carbohydrate ABC transporter permease [Microbacterium ulmi]NII68701.1 multiple sugar transport system permease protein [Microbacterium ulmi]NNH03636.1 carbohydrate ABC transporter permease [Microbacterium ulmi]
MTATELLVVPSARRAGPAPHRSARPRSRAGTVVGSILLIAFALALLVPFFWMVVSSFKDSNEIFSVPVRWLPDTWHWEHYVELWTDTGMATWLRNTIFLSTVVTFLQVLTGSFAAYGFAKVRFPGRDLLFLAYLATIAVPWQSYMIPQYIMLAQARLTNTLLALVVLQAFGAFGVFLMKQYFESIPEELSEAARIDGLNEYGIWARIMLPLSTPALASLALLTFVNTWNDYLGPLLYLRSKEIWTVQLGLKNFVANNLSADYAMLFTGLTISVIPIAVIFLLGQRYFVEGIATSGLKG